MGKSHPTYKPVRVDATVQEIIEGAMTEVEALIGECRYAAGNFREPDDPRGAAFAAAADALERVDLDASGVPCDVGHLPVSYQSLRPRRKAHTYARWARTENTAVGLRAVVQALDGRPVWPWLGSMLEAAAAQLDLVKYPRMFGADAGAEAPDLTAR